MAIGQMNRLLPLVALIVGIFVVGQPASAGSDLVHSTKYRDHRVRGTTPAEIWRYMNAHPIIDPDDGPAYANLTHDNDLRLKVATRGGACRVTDLTFRWRFVLTLPKAVDAAGMSARNRSLWTQFVAALKRHEETHRQIFLKCGARFVPAATKLTGSGGCIGMQRKVRRFIDRQYAACMVEQRAFEKRDRASMLGQPFIRAALRPK